MKAILYDKSVKGKLRYSEIEKPIPGDNEVLVKIQVISLNAADYRSLKMGLIPKKRIFGSAISGTVEAIGMNIQEFKPGDEVFADLVDSGFGGLAEYVSVVEKALISKPAEVSFEDASTLPIAFETALRALRDKAQIKGGNKVFIVGSSGGVGTFAVQLGKYFGAEVTAVCSTRNVEQSKLLGADIVIDYKKENFTDSNNKYDLILAINGNYSLSSYIRKLKKGGKCIIIGGSLSQLFKTMLFGWFISLGTKKISVLSVKTQGDDLKLGVELMKDGKLKAVKERVYSLNEAVEAFEYLSKGHASGKILIKT